MDKVNFNPFAEILIEDFLRQSGYIGESFKLLVADFLNQHMAVLGLEVTAQPAADMTVYVKPGRMYQYGQQGQLTANLHPPLTITAAHPNYPRIDRICAQYKEVADTPENRNVMVDTVSRQVIQKSVMTRIAGSIDFMVVSGVAAPGPAAPTVPDGWVSLAQVKVRAAATSILQSDVLDERPTLKSLATHTHTGGVDGEKLNFSGLTVNDGAVKDEMLGNKTITDTTVAVATPGTLTAKLSQLGNMIKRITGKGTWYDAPALTLEAVKNLFGVSGHAHTGVDGQGPRIAYSNITETPTSLPANGGNADGLNGVGETTDVDTMHTGKSRIGAYIPSTANRPPGYNYGLIASLAAVSKNNNACAQLAISHRNDIAIRGGWNGVFYPWMIMASQEWVQAAISNIQGTRVWVSSEYTPVKSTPTIATHNLNLMDVTKCRAEVLLKCVVANNGYAVGDYAIQWGATYGQVNIYTMADQAMATANTIMTVTGNMYTGINCRPKGGGDCVDVVLDNWRYVFRIWY